MCSLNQISLKCAGKTECDMFLKGILIRLLKNNVWHAKGYCKKKNQSVGWPYTHIEVRVMLYAMIVNIYSQNTYCHWFLQQNMVALLCKSHGRFLEHTDNEVFTQRSKKEEWHTYSSQDIDIHCTFTLWRGSGVHTKTASANFCLSSILCQSSLEIHAIF